MSRRIRIGAALAVALMLAALAAGAALAQDELLGGKLRTGDAVTIGADESVDGDLYVFAGTVTVDGSVDGDLTAFGGQILLNGSVTGDVLAAGGSVTIAGEVEGDVRTAGGQVTLNGTVGEDAVVAGGQATLQGGGSVDGDLVVSGGQITIAGEVAGNVEASAGSYRRTGTIGGDEHVVQGETDEDEPEDAGDDVAEDALDALRHFVVLLIIGALVLWLLPRLLGGAAAALRARPVASLGFGLLSFVGYIVLVIVAVIAIVLLAIIFGILQLGVLAVLEVIGGLLALFVATFGFILAVGFLADLVVGFGLARLVARDRETSGWREFGLLAAGVAVVVIVTSLPVIGGIAKLFVVLFGLGALFLAARTAWRDRSLRRTDAPPPPSAPAPDAPGA